MTSAHAQRDFDGALGGASPTFRRVIVGSGAPDATGEARCAGGIKNKGKRKKASSGRKIC